MGSWELLQMLLQILEASVGPQTPRVPLGEQEHLFAAEPEQPHPSALGCPPRAGNPRTIWKYLLRNLEMSLKNLEITQQFLHWMLQRLSQRLLHVLSAIKMKMSWDLEAGFLQWLISGTALIYSAALIYDLACVPHLIYIKYFGLFNLLTSFMVIFSGDLLHTLLAFYLIISSPVFLGRVQSPGISFPLLAPGRCGWDSRVPGHERR